MNSMIPYTIPFAVKRCIYKMTSIVSKLKLMQNFSLLGTSHISRKKLVNSISICGHACLNMAAGGNGASKVSFVPFTFSFYDFDFFSFSSQ